MHRSLAKEFLRLMFPATILAADIYKLKRKGPRAFTKSKEILNPFGFIVNCVDSIRVSELPQNAGIFSPKDILISKYLNGSAACINSKQMLADFEQTPIHAVRSKPDSKNPHETYAATRSTAREFIKNVAHRLTGMEPYMFQMSAGEQAAGQTGNRIHKWQSDFKAAYQNDNIKPGQAVAIIHTDYYLDPLIVLAAVSAPVLIYTFQPDTLAENRGNMCFTFNANDEIEMHFAGGTKYVHKIWELRDGDTVCVTRGRVMKTTTLYLIGRKKVAQHRYVIFFAPLRRWTCPVISRLAETQYSDTQLQHFKPVRPDKKFTAMHYQTTEGPFTAIGTVGGYQHTRMPSRIYDTLAAIAELSPKRMGLHHIRTALENENVEIASNEHYLIQLYFYNYQRETLKLTFDERTSRNQNTVYSYVKKTEPVEITVKPSIDVYMRHFGLPPVAPANNTCTHENAIHTRLEMLQWKTSDDKLINLSEDQTITRFMLTTIVDFATALFPEPHVLDKLDEIRVWETQSTPTQQLTLRKALMMQHALRVNSGFFKKESLADMGDARVISTVNPLDKLKYSQFMYSLSNYVKRFDWYAFGKTNETVANTVARVCADAKTVTNTDFSRFDGRVSKSIRIFETVVCRRAFKTSLHPELLDLMQAQYGLTTYVGQIKTHQGYSRMSGSAETSVFNTIVNRFLIYYAMRRQRNKETGDFYTHDEAWNLPSIHGGDDGLIMDATGDEPKYCAEWGAKLTIENVPRYSLGVKFLSRHYSPQVWRGCPDSCHDIKRLLVKFCAGPRNQMTAREMLIAKALSYKETDINTPGIGELMKSIMRITGKGGVLSDEERVRFRKHIPYLAVQGGNYPNNNDGNWMQEACDVTTQGRFDHGAMERWAKRLRSVESILEHNETFYEAGPPVSKRTVIYHDRKLEGKEPTPPRQPLPSRVKFESKMKQVARTAELVDEQSYSEALSVLTKRPKPDRKTKVKAIKTPRIKSGLESKMERPADTLLNTVLKTPTPTHLTLRSILKTPTLEPHSSSLAVPPRRDRQKREVKFTRADLVNIQQRSNTTVSATRDLKSKPPDVKTQPPPKAKKRWVKKTETRANNNDNKSRTRTKRKAVHRKAIPKATPKHTIRLIN